MIEAGLVLLIVVIVFGAFLILRSIKNFIINAVVGLVILFLANTVAGLGIGYSWLVILICGIGMALLIPVVFVSKFSLIITLFAISTFAYAAWSTMALSLPSDLYPSSTVASVSGMSGTGAVT